MFVLLRLIFCSLLLCATVDAADTPISAVSNSYARTKLPNGTYKAETYVFGEGERLDGRFDNDSMDALDFIGIARVLVPPLADQTFIQESRPKNTDLLIIVHWDTTIGTQEFQTSEKVGVAMHAVSALNNVLSSTAVADSRHLDALPCRSPSPRWDR